MTLEQTISAIRPLDEKSMTAARNRFANIAMPLGGLGLLQDAIVQLAGILGQPVPDISRRAAVVFCADNGVVAEGVTQCGQEVTATVAENMGRGESTVCLMAKQLGMDVFPVDIGVARPIKSEKVLQFAVRRGTANFAHEPAMTRKEALEAVEIGIKMAEMCAEKGYSLLIGGEMGIGNTTTSAAVTAALTGAEAAAVTGRGAGLSTVGLERKIAVIEAALALHKPDSNDSIDVLHKVGGLDIAGLCGLYLGAAAQRIPVVLDGVISCASRRAIVSAVRAFYGRSAQIGRTGEHFAARCTRQAAVPDGGHAPRGGDRRGGRRGAFGPGTGAISGNGELRGHWNGGISAAKVVVCLTDSTNSLHKYCV